MTSRKQSPSANTALRRPKPATPGSAYGSPRPSSSRSAPATGSSSAAAITAWRSRTLMARPYRPKALPGLRGVAVRAVHRRRDRGVEDHAAGAVVLRVVDRAAGLAGAPLVRVVVEPGLRGRRRRSGARQRMRAALRPAGDHVALWANSHLRGAPHP